MKRHPKVHAALVAILCAHIAAPWTWNTPAAAQTAEGWSCPPPPTAVRDLDIPRYYADAAGITVDPRLKAANDAAIAPLIGFVREVVKLADRAASSNLAAKREASARCALSWIAAWAKGGAWLGRANQQGEYQRKWDLGGIALAYVKVKPYASADERRVIEGWLTRVAAEARAFFDDRGRKRNNHWYWLGLSLAGVAEATGDDRWWVMAREIARDAATDIRPDGILPMELERGERALHYHAFSVMPLVVLAEIAASRGEDFYAFEGGALHRLVGLTLRGIENPAAFETIAGVRQKLTASSAGAGWLPLYRARFPERVPGAPPAMRTADRRLGGDVLLLMDHLRPRSK